MEFVFFKVFNKIKRLAKVRIFLFFYEFLLYRFFLFLENRPFCSFLLIFIKKQNLNLKIFTFLINIVRN
ncbi:MAG: hypothetical protein EAZ97_09605 [Bacteroidetes bacterium]|nr:MAG: hypothetical protein EAZ97_09605 [Bacteroidota bacterium]